jgi:sugar lactone lactonase YvrE
MDLIHTDSLGGKGQRPQEFRERLTGITVDAENRLFAVGDREVKRYSAAGKLEKRFPTHEAGWSITWDGDSIWVGMQGELNQYDFHGTLQSSIQDKDRLGRITGLAARDDFLLAADATNRTIHLYQSGTWQREVGRDVNTRGFMLPNGVLDLAWDAQHQSFVVAHPQKHRVERYSLEGELTDKFGRFGMEDPADFGGCCNPTNITTTADGVIAVSEKAPPRVKIFTSDGKFLAQSGDGIFDANTKNLDLAANDRGRLYATDPLRCTIEVFDLSALAN